MGQPEKPLDPETGPVQRFAYELRRAAEGPSYRAMAERAGFSAATLVTGGGRAAAVVVEGHAGNARACRGDAGVWERRWKEADAAVVEALELLPDPFPLGLARPA